MKLLAAILRPALVASTLTLLVGVTASTAAAAPVYYGANVHSLQTWAVTTAQMNQELNALQTAGANVARVDVSWSALEPTTPGQYNPSYLARLDAFMTGAAQRGIKVIATIACTPAWASTGGQWNDAPTDPTTYGNIAAFLSARYSSELAALEVWNEPNWNNNLIATNLPATYTAMVKAFFLGARRGNAGVPVLMGAMAYADLPFLRSLYADGIKGYYDGISVHPYADGAAPGNLTVTHSFLGGIESLHAAQVAGGDNTPIWVTEFGWPVGTSAGANTEAQSATYLQAAFALVDGLPYVRAATAYQLRDMATDPTNPEDNFGLLEQNFTPRPSYAAFTAAMAASRAAVSGSAGGTTGTSSTATSTSTSTNTSTSTSTPTPTGSSTSPASPPSTSTHPTKRHTATAGIASVRASIATVHIARIARRTVTHARRTALARRRRHVARHRRHVRRLAHAKR